MKTLLITGICALIVFVTAQPEAQQLLFDKFSREYFLIGCGLFGFWVLLIIADTAFKGITTLKKDGTNPGETVI